MALKGWTSTEWISLLGAVSALVGVVTAAALQILGALRQNMLATQENARAIAVLGTSIDGVKSELVAATRSAALAEGRDMMRGNVAAAAGLPPAPAPAVLVERLHAETLSAGKIEIPPPSQEGSTPSSKEG